MPRSALENFVSRTANEPIDNNNDSSRSDGDQASDVLLFVSLRRLSNKRPFTTCFSTPFVALLPTKVKAKCPNFSLSVGATRFTCYKQERHTKVCRTFSFDCAKPRLMVKTRLH
jgi:hypothetical protein